MRALKLIFVLMVLPLAAQAKGDDGPWDIRLSMSEKDGDTIEVFEQDKQNPDKKSLLLRVSAEEVFTGLSDYVVLQVPAWHKSILVTIWNHGSAAQEFKIYDPLRKKGKEICHYTASGPPGVSVQKGYLVFSVPKPKKFLEEDPDYRDIIVDDKFVAKGCREGNPSVPHNP